MSTDDALQTMTEIFVETLKTPLLNGSIWIYPDELDERHLRLCAYAYAAATLGRVTIEKQSNHSVARLAT